MTLPVENTADASHGADVDLEHAADEAQTVALDPVTESEPNRVKDDVLDVLDVLSSIAEFLIDV